MLVNVLLQENHMIDINAYGHAIYMQLSSEIDIWHQHGLIFSFQEEKVHSGTKNSLIGSIWYLACNIYYHIWFFLITLMTSEKKKHYITLQTIGSSTTCKKGFLRFQSVLAQFSSISIQFVSLIFPLRIHIHFRTCKYSFSHLQIWP